MIEFVELKMPKKLKCWKKVDENLWQNKDRLVFISIWGYPHKQARYTPHESYISEKSGRAIKRGAFKKSRAIQIAHLYMKEHDKC